MSWIGVVATWVAPGATVTVPSVIGLTWMATTSVEVSLAASVTVSRKYSVRLEVKPGAVNVGPAMAAFESVTAWPSGTSPVPSAAPTWVQA